MVDIMATGLSGLNTSQRRALTHANNLSNINTAGYRAQRANTATLPGGGSKVDSVTTSTELGRLRQTGNTTDLAIVGQGYFQVADADGNSFYTRDGNFTQDAEGRLVSNEGLVLQPEIQIPQNADNLNIAEDGTVSARIDGQTEELGQIELSNFSNEQGLTREGGNLLLPSGASGIPQTGMPGTEGRGYVMSGYVEGSNVDIAREMVGLREEEANYKANAAVIRTADEMQQEILDL